MKGHLMQEHDRLPINSYADTLKELTPEAIHKDRRTRRSNGERSGRKFTKGWPLVPARTRTGTTPHFSMWMADLKLKSTLQRTKLAALAESTQDPKAAAAYAIVASAKGRPYKSVWDLAGASRTDLLALSGVGPAKLTAIHADLTAHNVKVRWSV